MALALTSVYAGMETSSQKFSYAKEISFRHISLQVLERLLRAYVSKFSKIYSAMIVRVIEKACLDKRTQYTNGEGTQHTTLNMQEIYAE